MNKKRIIFVTVIILVIIAYVFWYYQKQNKPLTLYGNVDIRTVNIGFRVDGRLESLNVDEGDRVEPGQLLGQLDSAPYLNAFKQAQANLSSASARLELLTAGYRTEEIAQVRSEVSSRLSAFNYADSFLKRQQKLWQQKIISADMLESARSSRNQAQASLQAAKDKLAQYQSGYRSQEIEEARSNMEQVQAAQAQALLNLRDTSLLSPSAGTVLTRAVEPGTMLSAGSTVFTLSLTQPVWVRAYVSETHLGRAVPGTELQIVTDSRPNKPYRGKIGFVSPTAEFTPKNVETPELRPDLVYRLRIIVLDADDALRQGMPVTLHFPQKEAAQQNSDSPVNSENVRDGNGTDNH